MQSSTHRTAKQLCLRKTSRTCCCFLDGKCNGVTVGGDGRQERRQGCSHPFVCSCRSEGVNLCNGGGMFDHAPRCFQPRVRWLRIAFGVDLQCSCFTIGVRALVCRARMNWTDGLAGVSAVGGWVNGWSGLRRCTRKIVCMQASDPNGPAAG